MIKRLAFISLCIASAGNASAEEVKASHAANENCQWAPFESKELGVRFLFQKCEGDKSNISNCHFKTDGQWMIADCPSPDGNSRSWASSLFRVDKKPEGEDITQTLARFLPPDNADCKVVPYTQSPSKRGESYHIIPTGKSGELQQEELARQPQEHFYCGNYGDEGEWSTTFSYYPDESKTKYIYFLVKADDDFLYDPESVHFIAP